MKHAISKIRVIELTHNQLALITNLKALLDLDLAIFIYTYITIEDVNQLIYALTVD